MNSNESLDPRIRGMERLLRAAFAAGMASRVSPIYKEYWVGDFSEKPSGAIDIAWTYACGGKVDSSEAQKCLDEVQDLLAFYRDEEDIGVLRTTMAAALYALQSATLDEEAAIIAVKSSAGVTQHAAQYAEVMANDETSPSLQKELAVEEERAWQEQALTLLENWKGPARRDMFDSIGAAPPTWFEDWMIRAAHLR